MRTGWYEGAMFLYGAKKEEKDKTKKKQKKKTPTSKKWSQIGRSKVGQELSGV